MNTIANEPVRDTLLQFGKQMIECYLELYKTCMKGKRYALFEQRWFEHVHEYFTREDGKQLSARAQAWCNVVKRAEEHGTLLCCVSEQRIVVSTLASHVHDLMADEVLAFKTQMLEECEFESTAVTLSESNIALYRYGGFALHSMIQKRQHHVQKGVKSELGLLETLKVTKEQWDQISPAIQQLTRGGLVVPSPTLLPLLRMIMEKTSSLVNDQTYKEHGRNAIKLAKKELDRWGEPREVFASVAPSAFTTECKASVLTELVHKVFHARVNEYMNAAEEMELEREGKAVRADQCLRDTLKTFSSLTSRKV